MKTMLAAMLPLLIVPTAVSAGVAPIYNYAGEACLNYGAGSGVTSACVPVLITANPNNGTGEFDDGFLPLTFTWSVDSIVGGVVADLDLSSLDPAARARMLLFASGTTLKGGITLDNPNFIDGLGIGRLSGTLVP